MEEIRSKHKSIQSAAHHIALECIHPQVYIIFFLCMYISNHNIKIISMLYSNRIKFII